MLSRKTCQKLKLLKCDLGLLSNCGMMIITGEQEINPSYPNH